MPFPWVTLVSFDNKLATLSKQNIILLLYSTVSKAMKRFVTQYKHADLLVDLALHACIYINTVTLAFDWLGCLCSLWPLHILPIFYTQTKQQKHLCLLYTSYMMIYWWLKKIKLINTIPNFTLGITCWNSWLNYGWIMADFMPDIWGNFQMNVSSY